MLQLLCEIVTKSSFVVCSKNNFVIFVEFCSGTFRKLASVFVFFCELYFFFLCPSQHVKSHGNYPKVSLLHLRALLIFFSF